MLPGHCQAKMARIRQSRPESNLGCAVKVLKSVAGVPFSLGSDMPRAFRCRANVAHIRQSRPDSGLGFKANVLKMVKGVPSSLGSGMAPATRAAACPLERRSDLVGNILSLHK